MSDNLRLLTESCLKPIVKSDSSPSPRNIPIPGVFFRRSVIVICTAFVAGIRLSYRNQYVTSFGDFFSSKSLRTTKAGFNRSTETVTSQLFILITYVFSGYGLTTSIRYFSRFAYSELAR